MYFLWHSINSHVVFHVTISDLNSLFAAFRFSTCIYYFPLTYKTVKILWDLILTSWNIKSMPVCCPQINCKVSFVFRSTIDLRKMLLECFLHRLHRLFLRNEEQRSEKYYMYCAMFFNWNEGHMKNSANLEQETKQPKLSLIPFITSILNCKGNITDTSIPSWISCSITSLFRHFLI